MYTHLKDAFTMFRTIMHVGEYGCQGISLIGIYLIGIYFIGIFFIGIFLSYD